MNQTYFERYEFDVYVVRMFIAICTYEFKVVVSHTQST